MRAVVITNCYPDDNRGSAALNDAACTIIKQAFPGASISIVSAARGGALRSAFRHSLASHPEVEVLAPLLRTSRSGGLAEAGAVGLGLLWQLAPHWLGWGRSIAAIRAADLVVSRGGYLLADPGALRWWFNPYLIMLPCRLAHRLHKTTWTMPTSVIPPRSAVGRVALRHLVRSFDRVALRDPKARAAAVALGARDVRLYHDTVFVLPAPSAPQIDETVARHGLAGRRFGVVTTRGSGSSFTDVQKLALQAAVMRDLLQAGELDCVLAVAQTVGPDLDERPSALAFIELMAGGEARLLEGDFSHGDLMALYAAADIVVTQHLHSFIFATMVGTPALALSVDGYKVEGLVSGLGLPAWTVVDAAADASAVIERARRLRATRHVVRDDLLRASQVARVSVTDFIHDLAALDRA